MKILSYLLELKIWFQVLILNIFMKKMFIFKNKIDEWMSTVLFPAVLNYSQKPNATLLKIWMDNLQITSLPTRAK